MPAPKPKVNISALTPYQLGIIWSIGSWQNEGKIIFRHRDRYYLEQLEPLFESKIYKQHSRTGLQYALKTTLLSPKQLDEYGWYARNADQRNVPMHLPRYKDFLRAYIEIHGFLDYCTVYIDSRKKTGKYRKLRLRIYGNEVLIASLNAIIQQEIGGVLPKKPQIIHNGKTAILYYQNFAEIDRIYNYIFDDPYNPFIWEEVEYKLQHPEIHHD